MKFRVVSLNIWHGYLLDDVVAFLRRQDADIVLLQEVYSSADVGLDQRFRSFDELTKRLGYPANEHVAVGRERRSEGLIPFGNAILSRFALAARRPIFFNGPYQDEYLDEPKNFAHSPRVIQHVVAQTPAGELDVLNVHGPWDLAGERNSPARRRMAAAIVGAVQGRRLVVVAGDTNAKPVNPCWRPVERELASVFGNELPSTFNMKHKHNPGYATATVDMMFVSRNMEVLDKECPDADVSDHLPLVATLRATGGQP